MNKAVGISLIVMTGIIILSADALSDDRVANSLVVTQPSISRPNNETTSSVIIRMPVTNNDLATKPDKIDDCASTNEAIFQEYRDARRKAFEDLRSAINKINDSLSERLKVLRKDAKDTILNAKVSDVLGIIHAKSREVITLSIKVARDACMTKKMAFRDYRKAISVARAKRDLSLECERVKSHQHPK